MSSDDIVKSGSSSLIIGSNIYKGFINNRENMLLKVTKRTTRHNEFRHLNIIRAIVNYQDYFSIPEETCYLLRPEQEFYKLLMIIFHKNNLSMFRGDLEGYFINNAGNRDVQETVYEMESQHYSMVWETYRDILNFAQKIMQALKYLHERKLCHLDIKSENIVVNSHTKQFRIIDFGFCSQEPFDEFVKNPNGTPGYFPKIFRKEKVTKWLPRIDANDMEMNNNHTPMMINRHLVYKIDSFCLGRTIYFIKNIYDEYTESCCINWYQKSEIKVNKIMNDLLESDVNKRVTITECYDKYF